MESLKVSWKRVCTALAGFFILLLLVPAGFWYCLPWYEAREMAKYEGTSLQLTPLSTSKQAARGASQPVTVLGWKFSLPVDSVSLRKDRPTWTSLVLKEGGHILLLDQGAVVSFSKAWRSVPVTAKLFRNDELTSEYNLLTAAIQTTPAQISFWNSRATNLRLMMLFMQKSLLVGHATGIHPVSGNGFRGFEIETDKPGVVELKLWDEKDKGLWVILHMPAGWTQRDINSLLASLVPSATV